MTESQTMGTNLWGEREEEHSRLQPWPSAPAPAPPPPMFPSWVQGQGLSKGETAEWPRTLSFPAVLTSPQSWSCQSFTIFAPLIATADPIFSSRASHLPQQVCPFTRCLIPSSAHGLNAACVSGALLGLVDAAVSRTTLSLPWAQSSQGDRQVHSPKEEEEDLI